MEINGIKMKKIDEEYTGKQAWEITQLKDFYTHLHSQYETISTEQNTRKFKEQVEFALQGMKKYRDFFPQEIKELEEIARKPLWNF